MNRSIKISIVITLIVIVFYVILHVNYLPKVVTLKDIPSSIEDLEKYDLKNSIFRITPIEKNGNKYVIVIFCPSCVPFSRNAVAVYDKNGKLIETFTIDDECCHKKWLTER